MKKELSKVFAINLWDLAKGILMFFLTTLGDLIYQSCEIWMSDHSRSISLKEVLTVSIIATVMYILKQFFSGRKTSPGNLIPDNPKPKIKL